MSDTVISACITVGGMVATAVTAAIVQYKITRKVIESEHRKIASQITAETVARRKEERFNRIIASVSSLIGLVDPEINAQFDYPAIVVLILKTQLLLNLDHPLEGELNGVLTELGLTVRADNRHAILQLSDRLIRSTQALVKYHYTRA